MNGRPSRMPTSTLWLARRSARFVIDSPAISTDSGSVMPPASSVARLRVNCAMVIWRTVSPATGVFSIHRSIVSRPVGVRRQTEGK